ncbi:MAG: (deoxy)nucleoside triphosphate pyrophosphohydrolase [Acidobacteriota bacterium]
MSQPLVVVAAVVERDGKVLICRRRADARRHPLKWEFPGGKVEPGESPREALARELDEELGIEASIGAEIASYPYQYPDRAPIRLMFFRVTEYRGEAANREFAEILWEDRAMLPAYDFLEGDVDFVRDLARG